MDCPGLRRAARAGPGQGCRWWARTGCCPVPPRKCCRPRWKRKCPSIWAMNRATARPTGSHCNRHLVHACVHRSKSRYWRDRTSPLRCRSRHWRPRLCTALREKAGGVEAAGIQLCFSSVKEPVNAVPYQRAYPGRSDNSKQQQRRLPTRPPASDAFQDSRQRWGFADSAEQDICNGTVRLQVRGLVSAGRSKVRPLEPSPRPVPRRALSQTATRPLPQRVRL